MSQFNLSDIQSSSLLLSSDSFDEVSGIVATMKDEGGDQALDGLVL